MKTFRRMTVVITLFLLMCSLPIAAVGEITPTTPATQLEAFLAKKGDILIEEFKDFGSDSIPYGRSIGFQAVILYQPGVEKKKTKGLKVDLFEGTHMLSSSFLDLDEVESLSKALGYMIDLAAKWEIEPPKEYTRIVFTSKGDFGIGFWQNGHEQQAWATCGREEAESYFFKSSRAGLTWAKMRIDDGLEFLKKQ